MPRTRDQKAIVDIKIRMREPLRVQIEKAAAVRGVSMNAEMINRLERSFLRGNLLREALSLRYGPYIARALLGVATALETVGTRAFLAAEGRDPRDRWQEHPYAFDRAIKSVQRTLNFFRPKGEIIEPPSVTPEERRGKFWGISPRRYLDEDDDALDNLLHLALVDSELIDDEPDDVDRLRRALGLTTDNNGNTK
jgi:hypothetical protein